MTTNQHVAVTATAQHNLNRVDFVIKVTRRAWMTAAMQQEFHPVHVCIQCGYTGGFTHIYNGAHPECPMCKGE
jgi:rubrerythrin